MEEIVFVRRGKPSAAKIYNTCMIKMEFADARFLISARLAAAMELQDGTGVMFGFNAKQKQAYILKDDEPDAFIVRRRDKNSFRFTSKMLREYFEQTFGLDTAMNAFYFDVSEQPNDKGHFVITFNTAKA